MSQDRQLTVKSINDVKLPNDMFKDMSIEFLQTLNNQDEGTFFEFFQQLKLQDVKHARQRCEKVQEENREMALTNSDLEPQFTERKEDLRKQVTEAQDLKTGYEEDYQELKRFQSRTELSALRKQLQEATKTSEQTSEDFAYEFVNGKTSMSVDEFIEELVSKRSEYWLRKVKLEKFDELSKSRRPVPVPRTRGPTEGLPIPYQAPPMQSLPVGGPARTPGNSPTSSLPPYQVSPSRAMPGPPRQPFPAAAYPGYRPSNPGHPPARPPSYPSASPGYPPGGPSYPTGPPPRPAPYAQFRQHRY